MGKKILMIAALAALGACHTEETRERIRNGDLERPAQDQNAAQPAPALNQAESQPQ